MAQITHQADQNDLERAVEAVPAGEYTAIIEDSDYVENSKKSGNILKLTYQIIEGPLKGSKVFENLNIDNQSTQAEQIARRSLNSICVACGLGGIGDSQELHNIAMKIEVTVKDDPIYGKKNDIKKHMPLNQNQAAPQQAVVTANQTTSKPAPAKQRWEK